MQKTNTKNIVVVDLKYKLFKVQYLLERPTIWCTDGCVYFKVCLKKLSHPAFKKFTLKYDRPINWRKYGYRLNGIL